MTATQRLLGCFLALTTLRWLPSGLLIPVTVLLPLHRGLDMAEIGTAYAIQGLVVMALELPTGGLADALGRRPLLLLSAATAAAADALLLAADTFWLLAAFAALQGVHRALDSGPLEAWYVDAVHAIDPDAPIRSGMSAQGAALGLGVAAGAGLSGLLVALDPVSALGALALPVLVALGVQLVGIAAVAVLMVEHRPPRTSGVFTSLRETPRTIGEGIALLRGSRILLALVCVELSWGFGMVTFESLLPVRLSEVGGGAEVAGAISGPAVSAAWIASAAGSAVAGWLAGRVGTAPAAAGLRILQGGCVVLLGVLGGVSGLLTAYLACYVIHGTSNALHNTLLHHQVTSATRATMLSLNSMFAQPAGSVGLIVLTGVADRVSTSAAMVLGGIVLTVAAPLYVPAWRQEREDSYVNRRGGVEA